MLQESLDSKGPRVPRSIQSTQDSIKNGTTTLMRMTSHHEIPEFSDLGSRISDVRDLGISGSRVLGIDWSDHGLTSDLRLIGQSYLRSKANAAQGPDLDLSYES